MTCKIKLSYSLVAILILSVCLQAGQELSDDSIKLRADLVVLDVYVSNKKTGRPVGNLKKEDFVIYEDGVKQEITNFGQDKLPLSIVLLLDVSSSVQPIINQIRDNALNALRQLKPEDEIAILAFASRAKLIQDFTKDKQLVTERIASIKDEAQVGRGTLLDVGIYQASEHLLQASNAVSRRVIIAITDNVSAKGGSHSEKDVQNSVLESGAVVCGLVVKSWFSHTQNTVLFLRKFLSASDLKKYASETGGEVFNAGKEGIGAKLLELIQHLRTRYTLGYVSSNPTTDRRFRKVKIILANSIEKREGKLSVLTRKGYYPSKTRNDDTKSRENY